MAIMFKENAKIINNYINKKFSKEYETYTKKVMTIRQALKDNKNIEKNKATLKKLEEETDKKWGAKKAQHEYMLVAKRCMKFYAELAKNPDGMKYEDYQKLKRYTEVLTDQTMIDKIKENMTDSYNQRAFEFMTYGFREMGGIVNNWEKCHGKDLQKAFPLKIADFEKGKYSEVRDNVLDLDKLREQKIILDTQLDGYTMDGHKSHKNSKEFDKMMKAAKKLIGDMHTLLDERDKHDYDFYEDLSQRDSNELYKSIQTAKAEIRKYIEAKGGIENQKSEFGMVRMMRSINLYKEIVAVENLCITTEVVKANSEVWNALSSQKAPQEKAPDALQLNV